MPSLTCSARATDTPSRLPVMAIGRRLCVADVHMKQLRFWEESWAGPIGPGTTTTHAPTWRRVTRVSWLSSNETPTLARRTVTHTRRPHTLTIGDMGGLTVRHSTAAHSRMTTRSTLWRAQ